MRQLTTLSDWRAGPREQVRLRNNSEGPPSRTSSETKHTNHGKPTIESHG